MGIGTILLGILLLGIVIFVHELGHFLAAKWRRVTVLKFSLGMGPEMFGFTHGGTRYCLSWIPLGGFVQMAGDHLEDDGSMPKGGPDQFLTHSWIGRIVIAVAGPAANLVTAFVVLVLASVIGMKYTDWPNVVGPLPDTTFAYAQGIREGDRFVRLDGHELETWHDLATVPPLKDKPEVVFDLVRDGAPLSVKLPGESMARLLRELDTPPMPPVVGGVSPGLPAYRAGIQEGDRILSIDGEPVGRFDDIARLQKGRVDRPLVYRVSRGGREFDVTITPMQTDGKARDSRIGISAPQTMTFIERSSLAEAIPLALRGTGLITVQVYESMWLTVRRPFYYKDAVGGPLFIVEMAGESARQGAGSWLLFMAYINLAIMSFNLLPIPLLDGGHITLAFLEGLRKKAVSGRTYLNFQKVGLVLMGTLFVFILSKDLIRPFQRLRAIDQAPRESTTVDPSHR